MSFKKTNMFKYDISAEVFEKLNNQSSLAIDTEAMGLNIHRDRLCLIQICDSNMVSYLIHFPEHNYKDSPNLKKLLGNNKIQKIFHFARFDVSIICNYLGVLCENVICTRTISRIARTSSDKHGIKSLCKELLGVDLNKTQQSSYWGEDILNDSQINYAISDVINLHELHKSLQHLLKREKREKIAALACEVIPTLAYFDCNFFDLPSLLNYQH